MIPLAWIGRAFTKEWNSTLCIQIALTLICFSSGCQGTKHSEKPQEYEVKFEVVYVPANAPHGDREIIGAVKIEIMAPSSSGNAILKAVSLPIGGNGFASVFLRHGHYVARIGGINGLNEYSKVMWDATLPLNVTGASRVRISGNPKSRIDRLAVLYLNSASVAQGSEIRLFPIAYTGSLIKLLPLSAKSPTWNWSVEPPEAGTLNAIDMVFKPSQQWHGAVAAITASYGRNSTTLQLNVVP